MPDSIRHPVIPLDSADASQVPGFRRNDNRGVFNRRFNTLYFIQNLLKRPLYKLQKNGVKNARED